MPVSGVAVQVYGAAGTVHRVAAPSLKVTVPVGLAAPESVAVKVTGTPAALGLAGLAASVSAVLAMKRADTMASRPGLASVQVLPLAPAQSSPQAAST